MTHILPLNSDRWKALRHAYGSAGDVPGMLREMKRRGFSVEDDADLLWSYLCHQGTVYTATYAAAPHVLPLIDRQSVENQVMLLSFLGSVASSLDADPVPQELRPAYEETIAGATNKAIRLLQNPDVKGVDFTYLLLAVSALTGSVGFSDVLEATLVNGELWAKCPHCADTLQFDTANAPFHVQAVKQLGPKELAKLSEDVLTNFMDGEESVDPPVVVSPAQSPEVPWAGTVDAANVYEWLHGAALRASQEETAEKIRGLYGRCTCPTCHQTIKVMDAQPL